MTPRAVERNPAAVVFSLPGSSLEVLWIRGAGLFIGRPREAGGPVVRIEHPTADGSYDSEAAVLAALTAFLAAGDEQVACRTERRPPA
jgi:hypothetical protein